MTFLCYFLWTTSKSEYLWLQASVMGGFRMVLRPQWTSKSTDFVKNILQKSPFQAIRIQDLFQSALERPPDPPGSAKWGPQGLPKPVMNRDLNPLAASGRPEEPALRSRRSAEQIILGFLQIFISFLSHFMLLLECPAAVLSSNSTTCGRVSHIQQLIRAGTNFTYDHISITHNKWLFYVQQLTSFIKRQQHKTAQTKVRAEVDTCQHSTIHKFN